MFDTLRVRQDFSGAAPQYDLQTPVQKYVLSRLLAKALPMLPPRAKLLDAGCGTGRLARQCPEYPVTQLDIAHAMCKAAATPEALAVAGTIESLPFRDGVFDGVFCCLALQWVNEERLAVKEMQRVSRRGGVLAMSTFGPLTLMELRESFAAADAYPHVSEFGSQAECDTREVVTEYYPDLFSLMRHLKDIGARNKLTKRRKSMMTRGQMALVERRYEARFGTTKGLPVTWEIFYSTTRKS